MHLRRLPRRRAPLLNETVHSYLWRLAEANGLTGYDLQTHLAGSTQKDTVTAEQLAAVSGYPARTLRYAMLELCTPDDLATMQVAGRPRPSPDNLGWNWPYSGKRAPCHHCSARRGITGRRSDRAQVWTTHEDIICLRHRRWIGAGTNYHQPDLTEHPDILHANRQHRRMISRYGRDRVRQSIMDAAGIHHQWNQRFQFSDQFRRRLARLQQQPTATPHTSAEAAVAAGYPETVALARLFASRHQAVADNLNPEPFDHAILHAIYDEISAGHRHRDDIPDDIRVAAAGLLRQGPALTRFIAEIQRTVDPDYRWHPWPYHRRFPPITKWIMDQIDSIREPDNNTPHRYLPPEHFPAAKNIPRPRRGHHAPTCLNSNGRNHHPTLPINLRHRSSEA